MEINVALVKPGEIKTGEHLFVSVKNISPFVNERLPLLECILVFFRGKNGLFRVFVCI